MVVLGGTYHQLEGGGGGIGPTTTYSQKNTTLFLFLFDPEAFKTCKQNKTIQFTCSVLGVLKDWLEMIIFSYVGIPQTK